VLGRQHPLTLCRVFVWQHAYSRAWLRLPMRSIVYILVATSQSIVSYFHLPTLLGPIDRIFTSEAVTQYHKRRIILCAFAVLSFTNVWGCPDGYTSQAGQARSVLLKKETTILELPFAIRICIITTFGCHGDWHCQFLLKRRTLCYPPHLTIAN
jgi:hypothetical protein